MRKLRYLIKELQDISNESGFTVEKILVKACENLSEDHYLVKMIKDKVDVGFIGPEQTQKFRDNYKKNTIKKSND